ncbi:MAG: hypothetical protein AAB428_00130 [Patescibacteria group bacterium]
MDVELYYGAKDPRSAVVTKFMPGDGEKLTVSAPTQNLWGGLRITVVEGPDHLIDGLHFYLSIFRDKDPCWSSVRKHEESGGLCLSYDFGHPRSRLTPVQLLPLELLANLRRFSSLIMYSFAELVLAGDWNHAIKVEIPREPSSIIIATSSSTDIRGFR